MPNFPGSKGESFQIELDTTLFEASFHDVLTFIKLVRESFVGAVDVYTRGSCVRFALILERVFPGGQILYNIDHAVYQYPKGGSCFDITGQVVQTPDFRPLLEYGERGVYRAYQLRADIFSWMEKLKDEDEQPED